MQSRLPIHQGNCRKWYTPAAMITGLPDML